MDTWQDNQSLQNQTGMGHDSPQIQGRNTPPEPSSTDRPWVGTPFNVEMSATDPQQGPYPFNERHRDERAIRATIRFVEMLCRIDPRMEDSLVPNWPLDPYVFALMDALRTDFQAAYTSPFGPARPSRIQFSFWTDENSVLQLIRSYTQSPQSISETDLDKQGMFRSPNHTSRMKKREQFYKSHAADLGLVDVKTGEIIDPEGTYQWAPSAASQSDTKPDPKPEKSEKNRKLSRIIRQHESMTLLKPNHPAARHTHKTTQEKLPICFASANIPARGIRSLMGHSKPQHDKEDSAF